MGGLCLTSTSTTLAQFEDDNSGRRTALKRGGGNLMTTTYAYGGLSRLEEIALNLASFGDNLTRTFARNPAGQIIERQSRGSTAYDANLRRYLETF